MKYLGVAVLLSFSLILLGLQKPLDEPIYEYGMLTCVQDGLAFATFSFDSVKMMAYYQRSLNNTVVASMISPAIQPDNKIVMRFFNDSGVEEMNKRVELEGDLGASDSRFLFYLSNGKGAKYSHYYHASATSFEIPILDVLSQYGWQLEHHTFDRQENPIGNRTTSAYFLKRKRR